METKLYVGNLDYKTTEEDLQSLFTQAGTVVSVNLIKDRDSGRSKGFAFVEMQNQVELENAIKMFNSHILNQRKLNVNIARPREKRGQRGRWQRKGTHNGRGDTRR